MPHRRSRFPVPTDHSLAHRRQHDLRSYIPQLVRHIRAHNLYADLIELTYLDLTQSFYTKESSDLVARGDVPADEFLSKVDQRIKEEEERARAVLVESSVDAIKDTTRSALLTDRLPWLAKDGGQSHVAATGACYSRPLQLSSYYSKSEITTRSSGCTTTLRRCADSRSSTPRSRHTFRWVAFQPRQARFLLTSVLVL